MYGGNAAGARANAPDPAVFAEQKRQYLQEKSKRWVHFHNQKFREKRKVGYVDPNKPDMPPEHLRKIIKDHGDLSAKKFQTDLLD